MTTKWFAILALWAAGLAAAAQYGKIVVTFHLLGDIYPVGETALALAISMVGVAGIFLGVVAGDLVARYGLRRSVLFGLALGAAMSAVQSFEPGFGLFLISRIIEGVAHLAIVVSAPTIIASLASDAKRPLALSLWSTFFSVAFALLAWIGLPFVETAGLGRFFLYHGLYMLVVLALLWAILPEVKTSGSASTPLSLRTLIARHGTIYRSPWIGAPGVAWLFYTFCFVSTLALLPRYLPDETRALLIGAIPICSTFASMTLGVRLISRLGPIRVLEIGFICSALSLVLLWAFPGNTLICLTFAVFMGLIQGSGFAAVPYLNERVSDRALANGALAQTGNIGNSIGTPILVMLIGLFGYAGFVMTCAGMLVLAALAQRYLAAQRKRLSETQPG